MYITTIFKNEKKKESERKWIGVHQDKNVRKGIQVEGTAHAGLIGMNYKGSFRELQTDGVAEGVRQRYSSKYLINDPPVG